MDSENRYYISQDDLQIGGMLSYHIIKHNTTYLQHKSKPLSRSIHIKEVSHVETFVFHYVVWSGDGLCHTINV